MCELFSKTRTCPSQVKDQPWWSSSFFNQFCTYEHIYIYTIITQLKYIYICVLALRLLVASPEQEPPTQKSLRGCCVCARHFVNREIRFTAIFTELHNKLERVAIYILII